MNGIYLHLWLDEIGDDLIGQYVEEVRVADRIVQFFFGESALYVSLYPEAPAVYSAPVQKKDYVKNTKLSTELGACRIIAIEQAHLMPVLHIGVQKTEIDAVHDMKLTVMLYREAPNIIVQHGRKLKKLYPKCVDKKPKKNLTELSENEMAELSARSSNDLASYLLREIEGVDKYLAQELTHARLIKLREILSGVKARPRLVSVLPMRVSIFAEECIKVYPSFNNLYRDGVARFVAAKQETAREAQKHAAVRKIKKRIMRLQKTLLSQDAIEETRIAGELILGNLKRVKKGMHTVRLVDPYHNRAIEISLDPGKSAPQNAQAYFARYKKLKRGQPHLREKIAALEKSLQNIKTAPIIMKAGSKRVVKESTVSQPFRVFTLASGGIVYVGKSARSNEELTCGFARPHDYFFHVRGYEGSHVILRVRVPKTQKPQKGDLMTAASIAAYFSKAKTQKNVPVSYTQRKYVKKNKKGKPGAAIMMREQVMFVDPGLPEKTLRTKK
jgi:predicted ribosome quality control (RQC) complex YloA/Tae2 family protein